LSQGIVNKWCTYKIFMLNFYKKIGNKTQTLRVKLKCERFKQGYKEYKKNCFLI